MLFLVSLLIKQKKYSCRDFLDVNMTRTRMYISFLKPLLGLLDPPLEEFITRCKMVCCMMLCKLLDHVAGRNAITSLASAG